MQLLTCPSTFFFFCRAEMQQFLEKFLRTYNGADAKALSTVADDARLLIVNVSLVQGDGCVFTSSN